MRIFLALACTFSFLLILGGCAEKDGQRVVTVTLPVEAFFVSQLTDSAVEANVMVPVSVGHSTYTPLPSQMRELSKSQLYLAMGGLDFELAWRERFCAQNASMRWVELSDVASSGGEDPHTWMSPQRSMAIVSQVAKELKGLYPELEAIIDSSLSRLCLHLSEIDGRLISLREDIVFITYHPSLTYLAKDYGMRQIELEHEGKMPSVRNMELLMEEIDSTNITALFVQQGYDIDKICRLAEHTALEPVMIQPESYDYFATMETILKALGER
ncbi:MAG: zinc ABC transporter substrate-binding protein [Marinilabiliaceae bacterium]|nr:zinc ABC transporter substrate-binding protein [Marinilabiliaceae bacterium]